MYVGISVTADICTLTGCRGGCSSRDGCTDVGLRSCVGTEF